MDVALIDIADTGRFGIRRLRVYLGLRTDGELIAGIAPNRVEVCYRLV